MFQSQIVNRNACFSLQVRCIYAAVAALKVDMRGHASTTTGVDKHSEVELNRDEAVQELISSIENGGDATQMTAHQRLNTLATMLSHCEDAAWAGSHDPRNDPPALADTFKFLTEREPAQLADSVVTELAKQLRVDEDVIKAANLKIRADELNFLTTNQADIEGLIDQAVTRAQNGDVNGWSALASLAGQTQLGLLEKFKQTAEKAKLQVVTSALRGFPGALGDAVFINADIDTIESMLQEHTAMRRAHAEAESAVRRARRGRSTTEQEALEQEAVKQGKRGAGGTVKTK